MCKIPQALAERGQMRKFRRIPGPRASYRLLFRRKVDAFRLIQIKQL